METINTTIATTVLKNKITTIIAKTITTTVSKAITTTIANNMRIITTSRANQNMPIHIQGITTKPKRKDMCVCRK